MVQLAGLSMRWPSFSSLNSSSTGIPGYGEPPSVKISHIKTPNDQLEETETHSSDHFPSTTHSKHVPLVVHITLSISVLTVNTVRVYRYAIEMLNNQHFVQLFKGATNSSLFCGTITSLSTKFGWGSLCEMKPKIQIWSIYSGDICWRQQGSSCWGLNAVFLWESQTVDHSYTTQSWLLSSMECHNDTYCPVKTNISETHRKQTSRGRKIAAGNDFSSCANSMLLHLRWAGE